MSSTNRLTYVKTFRKRNNKKYYNIVKYPIIPLTINDIYITTIIGVIHGNNYNIQNK